MTTTRAVHASRPADTTGATGIPSPRLGTGRRVLRAVALAATVPYLTLKAAWLAGSHIGIPEGSVLLEGGIPVTVANAVTLAMDATVIVLVLALTRPWGRRLPGWLLVVPAYVATGLLTPIALGFPAQALVKAVGLGAGEAAKAGHAPFLESWVFVVVYTGFIAQGTALAGLFVSHARERWGGRRLGAPGQRLPSPTGVVAGAAALAGTVLGAAYVYWAFGGSAGLPDQRVAAYSAETGVVSGAYAVCAFAAAAGALLLARGGARPARWPLALTWTGSATMLAWGAFMLATTFGVDFRAGEPATTVDRLTYAGEMITGLLAGAVLVRHLRSRREG
ncbi:DUF3995 domain-containing protein [Streptomyces sp. WAC07061]|uniref:DUF3995 domain-containing protein n=1 Tax=Streptomyces sp. WAC07061 TaxID=2487410 RepID=UPI000F7AE97F|nr:DUF3995 domain-containing protein [Streptomyces sp. WAC07061]RSS33515.1 DUF3995 domain-containing protein [Streptomyces sp. WAC07061]